jgi:hypothetical protein
MTELIALNKNLEWRCVANGYRFEWDGHRYEVFPIGRYWCWRIMRLTADGYWLPVRWCDKSSSYSDEAKMLCLQS